MIAPDKANVITRACRIATALLEFGRCLLAADKGLGTIKRRFALSNRPCGGLAS